jgi:hypothetical protein
MPKKRSEWVGWIISEEIKNKKNKYKKDMSVFLFFQLSQT